MAHHQTVPGKTVIGTREIPDKLYFRIGEVAKLCEVPAYVLRFWESEFPQLKPNKGGTGQRLYRRRDVEMALRVKTLLYDEGYTIAGARQAFKSESKKVASETALVVETGASQLVTRSDTKNLQKLRGEMQDLLDLLSKPVTVKPVGATVQSIRSVRGRRAVAEPEVRSETGSLFGDMFPPKDV